MTGRTGLSPKHRELRVHTHGWDILRCMPAVELRLSRDLCSLPQVPLEKLVIPLQQEAREHPRFCQRFHRFPKLHLSLEPSSWSSASLLSPRDANRSTWTECRRVAPGSTAEDLVPLEGLLFSPRALLPAQFHRWEDVVNTVLGMGLLASLPWLRFASPCSAPTVCPVFKPRVTQRGWSAAPPPGQCAQPL